MAPIKTGFPKEVNGMKKNQFIRSTLYVLVQEIQVGIGDSEYSLTLTFLDFAMGMIAGMLYLGVMLVAFVPTFCVVIVLCSCAIIYLRFRHIQFQIFHPHHSVKKSASDSSSDPPPDYETALTMPTGGTTVQCSVVLC